jgi:biopolymer transport protein ExbB/TolQ
MRMTGRTSFWTAAAGGVSGAMAASAAWAVEATYVTGPIEKPVCTVVPPADRLTVGDVFANAAPEVQVVMALLVLGTLAALAVWALSLGKVGKADAKGLAGALGRLRIVRSGGAPLGCLAAAYVMFASFLAISNVRPTPTLSVVAPGLAEAALAIVLGLLATTVAVICERHLEGRIRRAAA